jgi:BirA family transcriptional regulator, biotin operon repressor / biotin---[acetyl-CoA-carboxylase] ligase
MRLWLSKLLIAPAVIRTNKPTANSIITTRVAARWNLIVLLAYRRVAKPSPRVVRLQSVTSTQDIARLLPIGSVVVAEHQTAGRGRLDHRWESPPGTALLVSFVLQPNPLLSLAAGVATAEACGGGVRLKWPNDLLLGGSKVGGILVEGTPSKAICGIGVNLSWAPPGAATLNQDRDQLLDKLRIELERWAATSPDDVLDRWRELSDTLGRRVRVELPGKVIEGTAQDIGSGGELIVDGESVTSGSVIHL